MKLYHGTSEKKLEKIMREGLVPRGRRKGNWETAPSRGDSVYLTEGGYAIYFGQAATQGERMAVVEVEVDEDLLLPDEDFLEQSSRKQTDFAFLGTNMLDRTLWFRDNATYFRKHWRDSLERLGTVSHLGDIGAEQITRAITLPVSCPISFAADPTISLDNHAYLGGYYRQLMRLAFGDEVNMEEAGFYRDQLVRLKEHTGDVTQVQRLGVAQCS